MIEFIPFPKIGQFRNTIKHVRMTDSPLPVLEYEGTIKLHGTNAAICQDEDGNIWFQSRKRVITPDDDNHGFAEYMANNVGYKRLQSLFAEVKLKNSQDHNYPIAIFGEWCGGNIQNGVALSELEKMFVIFGIRLGEEDYRTWYNFTEDGHDLFLTKHRIFNALQFQTKGITIDFSSPALSQNKLGELTEEVERECPVAKFFDVSGVGEGIVWKCVTKGYESSNYWFKVKGEKHSASKVKTLAPVDLELVKSIDEFINNTVTPQRLEQGIEILHQEAKPISEKSTGDFLRWVFNDVYEEEADIIEASGFDKKMLGKPISQKAKEWFFSYLDDVAA